MIWKVSGRRESMDMASGEGKGVGAVEARRGRVRRRRDVKCISVCVVVWFVE